MLAHRHILFEKESLVFIDGPGNLLLRLDPMGHGIGHFSFSERLQIKTTHKDAKIEIYYNPIVATLNIATGRIYFTKSNYSNPYNFSRHIDMRNKNNLNASMLVNNIDDLNNIRTNLARWYAQGCEIDATVTEKWTKDNKVSIKKKRKRNSRDLPLN